MEAFVRLRRRREDEVGLCLLLGLPSWEDLEMILLPSCALDGGEMHCREVMV